MKRQPKVSFFCPSYNHEKYIRENIESILNQTFPVHELIVIDDASSDTTPLIVEEYATKYPQKVKFIKGTENLGVGKRWNQMIDIISGDYLACIGSDDVLPPDALEKRVNFMEENSDIDLLLTDFDLLLDGSRILKGKDKLEVVPFFKPFYELNDLSELYVKLLNGNFIQIGAGLIRLNAYDRDSKLVDHRYYYLHDYDQLLKLILNHKIGFIPDSTYYYRWHDKNSSSGKNPKRNEFDAAAEMATILSGQLIKNQSRFQREKTLKALNNILNKLDTLVPTGNYINSNENIFSSEQAEVKETSNNMENNTVGNKNFTEQNSSEQSSKNLEFTGERFVPELDGQIAYEHLHRYAFASELVKNKTVLDIASGEGYGSALLSKVAKEVVGVDISEQAVNHAVKKYKEINNLSYRVGKCQSIPCEENYFDAVVSFETLEHIIEQKEFFSEIKRVLKKDGLLIISTPNKKIYSDERNYDNPYHLLELNEHEFLSLLNSNFRYTHIFGQRLTFSSHLWPIDSNFNFKFKHYHSPDSQSYVEKNEPPFDAEYYIAVCSNGANIPESYASLYTGVKNEMMAEFNNRYEWAKSLERDVEAKNRIIDDLNEQIKNLRQSKMLIPTGNMDNPKPNLNSLIDIAQIHIKQHNFLDAYLLIRKVLLEDPEHESAKKNYSSLFEAIEIKRKKLKWNPKKNVDPLLKAEKFIENQNYGDAKNILFDILNLQPDNVDALNNLSVVAILENNTGFAYDLLNAAKTIEPNNEVTLGNLEYLQSLQQTQQENNFQQANDASCGTQNLSCCSINQNGQITQEVYQKEVHPAAGPNSNRKQLENGNEFSVTLIQCPAWGRETPPVAISLLGGNLRSKGYKVHLFDLNNEFYHLVSQEDKKYWNQEYYAFWNDANVNELVKKYKNIIDDFVDQIVSGQSKLIGFSLVFTAVSFTNIIADMIRKRLPDCKIVYGGASTAEYAGGLTHLDKPFVDAIVLREGDITLPVICNDLKVNGDFVQTPGLVFKKNGEIINGGLREPVQSLDSIPFPDYSDFDLHRYSDPYRLDMFSSRGCVNQCHYCDERKYLQRYRFRSGKSLYEEVKYHLSKFPWVRTFNFADSVLNGSLKEIGEFARLLVENKVYIKWSGQAIVRKDMTPELLQLMADSGCLYLGYGVETGSPKVLKSMNKKLCSIEAAENNLRDTRSAGIRAYANFMFGYPTETEEDFQQTLDFVYRNALNMDGVSPSQSFTVIVPNTYLYENPEMFGVEKNPHHLYWSTIDGKNTYPVRFERYERFCKLCLELGLSGVGVVEEKIDKWKQLGAYYKYKNDYKNAIECYQKDLLKYGYSLDSFNSLLACYKNGQTSVAPELLQVIEKVAYSLGETVGKLEKEIKEINSERNGQSVKRQTIGNGFVSGEDGKLSLTSRNDSKQSRFNAEMEQSIALINLKNFFEANMILLKVLKEDPKNAMAEKYISILDEKIIAEKKERNWNSKKSLENILEAERLIEEGSYEEAKKILLKLLTVEPKHLEAVNDLSVIFILEKQFEQAIELIQFVLRIDPGNDVAVGNMEYLQTQMAQDNNLKPASINSVDSDSNQPNGNHGAETSNGKAVTVTTENSRPQKQKGIICLNPFYEFEIDITGKVVVCCTAWMKHSLGNMKNHSIGEIWNSQAARYMRRKMYKGEWEDICNASCPTIVQYTKYGTVIPFEEIHKNPHLTPKHAEEILAGKDKLESTPTVFKLSDSKVCNLKCKMCSVIHNDDLIDDKEMLERRTEDLKKYLDKAKTILVSGNGDPFARKDTRELMMNYKPNGSNLEFSVVTNGLLLPKYWDKVKHQKFESINVSVDAATKDVYEKIRYPGKWEDILKTFDLLRENKKSFKNVLLSMVVMRSNYKQIPAFNDMAESYGFMPLYSRIHGMFENENIFELNDTSAINDLRSIVKNEKKKRRSVEVIWQDIEEFAN